MMQQSRANFQSWLLGKRQGTFLTWMLVLKKLDVCIHLSACRWSVLSRLRVQQSVGSALKEVQLWESVAGWYIGTRRRLEKIVMFGVQRDGFATSPLGE